MNDKSKTFKDYASGEEVRWCPGCGDYAILKTMQKTLAAENIPLEECVFVSGIGCAARFPYYMNTYGFHTIHGRAPAIATGLKMMRPELKVWIVTGDGDAMSIGGNHFMHLMRRNLDVTVLLFNNRVYGLTKGQYSPTSPVGMIAPTTPHGALDEPLSPLAVALASGATFVARALDVDSVGLQSVLQAALDHKGTAIIEIYQNCHIYNDGAFQGLSDKETRPQYQLWCEAGKPLCFGAQDNLTGLTRRDWALEPVKLEQDAKTAQNIVHHDPSNIHLAQQLVKMEYPAQPVAMGVLYQTQRPCYESQVSALSISPQSIDPLTQAKALQDLLGSGQTWEIAN
jgi:2-oxoglutarate/2-oxoacid ferredoxin oxidoreductase subunit beta